MKRLTRNDNKRYHTAGIVDDIKVGSNKFFQKLFDYPITLSKFWVKFRKYDLMSEKN